MDAKLIAVAMLAIVLPVFLAGCSHAGGDFCAVSAPIIFANDAEREATPAEVKRSIVNHNLKGQRLCGWKAPRR